MKNADLMGGAVADGGIDDLSTLLAQVYFEYLAESIEDSSFLCSMPVSWFKVVSFIFCHQSIY